MGRRGPGGQGQVGPRFAESKKKSALRFFFALYYALRETKEVPPATCGGCGSARRDSAPGCCPSRLPLALGLKSRSGAIFFCPFSLSMEVYNEEQNMVGDDSGGPDGLARR